MLFFNVQQLPFFLSCIIILLTGNVSIDTDKKDNRLVNLRWTTHQENINNPLTRLKFKTCHGKK